MGTGKSQLVAELAKESKSHREVVDHDFQPYCYIYDKSLDHLSLEQKKGFASLRTQNPAYPANFTAAALEHLNAGRIVLSPFIEHVFDAYNAPYFKNQTKDVRKIIVMPHKDNFAEYEQRYLDRKNNAEFIERRRAEFPRMVELFETAADDYEKIIPAPNQVLAEILRDVLPDVLT